MSKKTKYSLDEEDPELSLKSENNSHDLILNKILTELKTLNFYLKKKNENI